MTALAPDAPLILVADDSDANCELLRDQHERGLAHLHRHGDEGAG